MVDKLPQLLKGLDLQSQVPINWYTRKRHAKLPSIETLSNLYAGHLEASRWQLKETIWDMELWAIYLGI